MTGNNKITVCHEEMRLAVQHYFKSVLFKPNACPEVRTIRQSSGVDGSFEIEVSETK